MKTDDDPIARRKAEQSEPIREKAQQLFRSSYNFFSKNGGTTLAYNARTGKFAMLTKDDRDLLLSTDPIDPNSERDNLVNMGFVHHGEEVQLIKDKYFESIETGNQVAFTVAPTMACNLRCSYCYQQEHRSRETMSYEIQDATLRFIEERIKKIKALSPATQPEVYFCWYGGEPLLETGSILEMSRKIRESIDRLGGHAELFSMVSNCSLMDRSTAKALSEVGIGLVQVSFDALVDGGVTRRGVLQGNGEPSVIFRNALSAQEYMKVRVRINVMEDNKEELEKMVSTLESEGLSATFGLARVFGGDSQCCAYDCRAPDMSCEGSTTPEFPNIMKLAEFAQLESRMQIKHSESKPHILGKLTPRAHYCGATTLNMFVIDPEGYVSRCWESVGIRAEATDHVIPEKALKFMSDNEEKWRSYDPFEDSVCLDCIALPLCMGGCPHEPIFSGDKTCRCLTIRDQIQDFTERVAGSLTVKLDIGNLTEGDFRGKSIQR